MKKLILALTISMGLAAGNPTSVLANGATVTHQQVNQTECSGDPTTGFWCFAVKGVVNSTVLDSGKESYGWNLEFTQTYTDSSGTTQYSHTHTEQVRGVVLDSDPAEDQQLIKQHIRTTDNTTGVLYCKEAVIELVLDGVPKLRILDSECTPS